MSGKILLIDDDEDILEIYAEALQIAGYTVSISTTAKRTLELYQRDRPCLVFLDVKMPNIDGYELFLKIRELDSSANVVLVTGHEDKEKTIIAKNKGLLDVLEKPMDLDALKQMIRKHNC